MPRKLKTFVTTAGFYELAIAAPSMAAALRAWGADTNLFQHGLAEQTNDRAIVAATMAKPGIVLRRPVGAAGKFSEHAGPPTGLSRDERARPSAKPRPRPKAQAAPKPRASKAEDKADRAAARAYEREQTRQQREDERREAARQRARERRAQAIAKAEAALDQGRRDHEATMAGLKRKRAEIAQQMDLEETRWGKRRMKLEDAVNRA